MQKGGEGGVSQSVTLHFQILNHIFAFWPAFEGKSPYTVWGGGGAGAGGRGGGQNRQKSVTFYLNGILFFPI
jgi:hypothetical protein